MKKIYLLLLISAGFLHAQVPPLVPLTLPFYENFENTSGTVIGDSSCVHCDSIVRWDFETSGQIAGRLDFDRGVSNTTYNPQDFKAATMDDASTPMDTIPVPHNFLIGTFDMSGYDTSTSDYILLDFYHYFQGTFGMSGGNDGVFIRGSSSDPWIHILNLRTVSYQRQWVSSGDIDIAHLLREQNQNFTSTFQIRFEQDGQFFRRNFDDIRIRQVSCMSLPDVSFSVLDASTAVLHPGEYDLQQDFQFEYGPCGFAQGNGTLGTATLGPDTLIGLSQGGCYDFYVRRNCPAAGYSEWTGPFSLTIDACNLQTAPYFSGFENVPLPEIDSCFSVINYLPHLSSVEGSSYESYSGSNSIVIGNNYVSSSYFPLILVTPRLIDIDTNKQVSFFIHGYSGGVGVEVGTMSIPTDPTTFSSLDTILSSELGSGEWREHIVKLDKYSGTGQFIGFRHRGSYATGFFLDNLRYERSPTCFSPDISTMTVDSVTGHSAVVRWGSGGTGDATVLVWGPMGFDPSKGIEGSDTVPSTDTTYHISGLASQTIYEFYLKDSCGVDSISDFVGPVSFATGCAGGTLTLPFVEDFESYSTRQEINAVFGCGPGYYWDWTTAGGISALDFVYDTTGSYKYFNGYRSAKIRSGHSNDSAFVTLTADLSNYTTAGANIELSYHFANHLSSSNSGNKVWTRGSKSDPWIEVAEWYAESNGWGWNKKQVYLDTLLAANNQVVSDSTQIRWVKKGPRNKSESGLALDDIRLRLVSCSVPANVAGMGVGDTAALFTWEGSGAAQQEYEVWLGPKGFYNAANVAGGVRALTVSDSIFIDSLFNGSCYDLLVREICAVGDTSDWSEPVTFCTSCPVLPVPYFEDFDQVGIECTGNLGNCWETSSSSQGTPFPFTFMSNKGQTLTGDTGPSGDAGSGTGTYMYLYSNGGVAQDTAKLISPAFDLSLISDPELRFSYHMFGIGNGNLIVDVNDGTGWNNALVIIGSQQSSSTSAWGDTTVDLSGYGSQVRIRFRSLKLAVAPLDIAIDNVKISRQVMVCGAPSLIEATNVTASTADISFLPGTSDTSTFEISYGPYLNDPENGSKLIFQGDSASLSGLTHGADYCLFIREYCGAFQDTGEWSAPYCFSTECAPFSAPYFESFDNVDVPALPRCWGKDVFVDSIIQTVTLTDDSVSPVSAPNAIEINNDTSGALFASAQFADLNSGLNQIRMMVSYEGRNAVNTGDSIYVGTVDSSMDRSSFIHLDTLPLSGNTSPFFEYILPLDRPSLIGSNTRIAFLYKEYDPSWGGGFEFYFDNFKYERSGRCPVPASMTVLETGCDSLYLSWNSDSLNSLVEFGHQGFSPGTGSTVAVNHTAVTLRGLNPGVHYDIYVASICENDTSVYYGPMTYSTATIPRPVAHIQVLGDSASGGAKYFALDASGSVDAEDFLWDFGNGDTATGVKVTAAYQTNGTKNITLAVGNACGVDSASTTVNVDISISESLLSKGLNIYPNPAEESVLVSFDRNGESGFELILRDLVGKEIFRTTLPGEGGRVEYNLDLLKFADGVYILEIQNASRLASKQLIKK